jgi:glycosyltransferase involved in cell wall biosynthesis
MIDGSVHTVAICYPQVLFADGGTERLVRALRDAFNERGFRASLVSVPFRWYPKNVIADHCLAWRLLELEESNGVPVDLLVATKFPSYIARHRRKVTWLIHQFRQVYDLFGNELSEFCDNPEDHAIRRMSRVMDRRTLGESRRVFAISHTVADRLRDSTGLEATPLYPPPRRHREFRTGESRDYVLAVGRLERTKRFHLLVEGLRHTPDGIRCIVIGDGPEAGALCRLAADLGVESRIEFRSRVSFKELVRLYSHCFAVYHAPYLEDFGYVTVEAFLSLKPVVTVSDAGGVLELVQHESTGIVAAPTAEGVGAGIVRLDAEREWARELGRAGHERVRHIQWDPVIEALVSA